MPNRLSGQGLFKVAVRGASSIRGRLRRASPSRLRRAPPSPSPNCGAGEGIAGADIEAVAVAVLPSPGPQLALGEGPGLRPRAQRAGRTNDAATLLVESVIPDFEHTLASRGAFVIFRSENGINPASQINRVRRFSGGSGHTPRLPPAACQAVQLQLRGASCKSICLFAPSCRSVL